ncbi:MFS transporter [Enterococcus sp.]|uniref:MFS transporter n=1 Tax=Enterococcus sp. TaxID=35783 RepID=UPI0028AFD770|nr:MFS transporter [Enterococcus sp.]
MQVYLQNKGYRVLVNAALLTGIGMSLFNIVFVIYASTLPFNTLAVSLASMAMLVPNLLQILTGHLADRTQRKVRWMMTSRLFQGVLFLLLAWLIQLPPSLITFLLLLAINILSDCLGAYSAGLQLPYVRRLVPAAALDQAMGFQMACQTTIQIIFQGIGAWAIVFMDHQFALFGAINALTFFLAAIVIFLHRPCFIDHTPSSQNHGRIFANTTSAFHLVTAGPFLRQVLFFALMINTLAASTSGLMNIDLLTAANLWFASYGNTVAMTGIATSIGMIAGALFTNDWFSKMGLIQLIGYTSVMMALAALNFLVIGNRWWMMISLFVVGYLIGKINPRLSAYIIREIDEKHLALVSGFISTVVMLGGPIGQLVFLGIANRSLILWSWLLYIVLSMTVAAFAYYTAYKAKRPAERSKVDM